MIRVALLHALALAWGASAQDIAVRGTIVHTMAGEAIADGVVVVTAGKIAAVGPAAQVKIPENYKTLEAAVVTPGLIDARCTVGVSGILNQRQDQDQLERSAPMQPELRAIDAYNPLDPLVEYVRSYGITTINTGHAPGELISGQTGIFKTSGQTVGECVVVPEAFVAATLGPQSQKSGDKSPGSRAKQIALLREQLIKAREYADKLAKSERKDPEDKAKDPPARDLRLETLARVLKKELPLLVTANHSQDIASVVRLAEEFDVRLVLDSASEAYLHAELLKEKKIDVILHPTMARAFGELENKSFETAGLLRKAGVRVAIQGGYESYVPKARVVLFEAGYAAAHGAGFEGALASITIDAAKILGVDHRVGSLRVGLDGDLALFDGDPFEYTTHCTGVVIDGVPSPTRGR